MNMLISTLGFIGRGLTKNPSLTSSLVVFGLGFGLVANNAINGQNFEHPSPIYPSKAQEARSQGVQQISVNTVPVSRNRTMLTTPASLKNIPIPTSNPIRQNKTAFHSSLVRDVQSSLADIGLYNGKVDGIYGSETRQAIISYQQSAGILPDGEASFGLLTSIKSVAAVSGMQRKVATLRKQLAGPVRVQQPEMIVFDQQKIARIQSGLRDNFADETIDVDGMLGKQTKSAIRRFQERFNLQATGELDQKTLDKLVSVGIIDNI